MINKNMLTNTRITSDNITTLEENEIFVFGSNERGVHGAGAAEQALKFGAKWGTGSGMSGTTYAIPTKDYNIKTLPLHEIKIYVDLFISYATRNRKKIFLVTEIGCGLAGYSAADIAPLFKLAITVENIHLPKAFWEILETID